MTTKIVNAIKKVDKYNKVDFIVLYGSYLTKKFGKLSDIDIAVYYNGNKKERLIFRIKLAGELSDKYDIKIFQDLPLYIKNEIIKKGKIIYKSNIKKLTQVYIESIREYAAFEKHLNLFYETRGAEIA